MKIEYRYSKKQQEVLDLVEGELGKLLEEQVVDYQMKCKESHELHSGFGAMLCPELRWCGDVVQIAYLRKELEEMKKMFVPESIIIYKDPTMEKVVVNLSVSEGTNL